METPPPRFSPDNSAEARAMRMRAIGYVVPRVVEVPHLYVLSTPAALEGADNVVYLPVRQNPEDIVA